MNTKRICVIGNSVALRVRPTLPFPNNKNYFQLLEDKGDNNYTLYNLAHGASSVKDIYKRIDEYIRVFPSYFILNLGVVDASTREVPLWFYRLATKKTLSPIAVLFKIIYRNIIARFRNFLVVIRGKRSWVSERKFEKYFDLVINTLLKETNSKIIVLSINLANNRVESELPGSLRKHKIYNDIMKKITNNYNQLFVDTNDIIELKDYPDGVHFSKSGHEKIADHLYKIIDNQISISK